MKLNLNSILLTKSEINNSYLHSNFNIFLICYHLRKKIQFYRLKLRETQIEHFIENVVYKFKCFFRKRHNWEFFVFWIINQSIFYYLFFNKHIYSYRDFKLKDFSAPHIFDNSFHSKQCLEHCYRLNCK